MSLEIELINEAGELIRDLPNGPEHNVKAYGAEGDGQTDDSQAFQDACDAAAGGGVVYIPAGEYRIDDVNVSTNTIVRGDGPESELVKEDTSFQGAMMDAVGSPSDWVENIVFRDFSIDGRIDDALNNAGYDNGTDGLDPEFAENVHIDNVHVHNVVADGLDLDAVRDFTVTRCHAERCGKFGLHVTQDDQGESEYCRHGSIYGNTFTDCGEERFGQSGGGMDVIYGEYITISNNTSYDNHRHGFVVDPIDADPELVKFGPNWAYDNDGDDYDLIGCLRVQTESV